MLFGFRCCSLLYPVMVLCKFFICVSMITFNIVLNSKTLDNKSKNEFWRSNTLVFVSNTFYRDDFFIASPNFKRCAELDDELEDIVLEQVLNVLFIWKKIRYVQVYCIQNRLLEGWRGVTYEFMQFLIWRCSFLVSFFASRGSSSLPTCSTILQGSSSRTQKSCSEKFSFTGFTSVSLFKNSPELNF